MFQLKSLTGVTVQIIRRKTQNYAMLDLIQD